MNIKSPNRENSPPFKGNPLKKSNNFEGRQSKQLKLNKNTLRKKRSHSKSKQSIPKNMFRSIHATFDKKQEKEKKKKKEQTRKNLFQFDKMEIIESKEFKQLCNLQNQYRRSLKSGYEQIKWLIPQEQLRRHSFSTFPDYIKEEDFEDLNNLMVNFLHFVCKRRIVRDQEFDFIYEGMLIKFPKRQQQIKRVLIQILNVLES